jgi:hypothetical protein
VIHGVLSILDQSKLAIQLIVNVHERDVRNLRNFSKLHFNHQSSSAVSGARRHQQIRHRIACSNQTIYRAPTYTSDRIPVYSDTAIRAPNAHNAYKTNGIDRSRRRSYQTKDRPCWCRISRSAATPPILQASTDPIQAHT